MSLISCLTDYAEEGIVYKIFICCAIKGSHAPGDERDSQQIPCIYDLFQFPRSILKWTESISTVKL